MIAKTVDVLIEGENPRNAAQRKGRTLCYRMTMVDGDFPDGTLVRAKVSGATTRTLFAEPVTHSTTAVASDVNSEPQQLRAA